MLFIYLPLPAAVLSHTDRDAVKARQLLEEELSQQIYQERKSLLFEWWNRLSEAYSAAELNLLAPTLGWIVVATVVALSILVLLYALNLRSFKEATKRPSQAADSAVFDDQRTAVQYLAAAHNALHQKDYTTAYLEQFRHLIKLMETKGRLQITPGLTALEASRVLQRSAPSFVEELVWAAQNFNSLRFGQHRGNLELLRRLQTLDGAMEQLGSQAARVGTTS